MRGGPEYFEKAADRSLLGFCLDDVEDLESQPRPTRLERFGLHSLEQRLTPEQRERCAWPESIRTATVWGAPEPPSRERSERPPTAPAGPHGRRAQPRARPRCARNPDRMRERLDKALVVIGATEYRKPPRDLAAAYRLAVGDPSVPADEARRLGRDLKTWAKRTVGTSLTVHLLAAGLGVDALVEGHRRAAPGREDGGGHGTVRLDPAGEPIPGPGDATASAADPERRAGSRGPGRAAQGARRGAARSRSGPAAGRARDGERPRDERRRRGRGRLTVRVLEATEAGRASGPPGRLADDGPVAADRRGSDPAGIEPGRAPMATGRRRRLDPVGRRADQCHAVGPWCTRRTAGSSASCPRQPGAVVRFEPTAPSFGARAEFAGDA